MRTLYLHCGLAKTGTTSIQHALAEARAALRAQDFDYPDLCCVAAGTAHHNIPRELLGAPKYRRGRGTIEELLAYLERPDRCRRVALSSEGLTPCLSTARDRTLDFVRALQSRNDRLVILFTCRRIWRVCESIYLARLAKGSLRTSHGARPATVTAWLEQLFVGIDTLCAVLGGDAVQWCDTEKAGGDAVSAALSALEVVLPGATSGRRRFGKRISLRAAALLYQAQFTPNGAFREPRLTPKQFKELRRRVVAVAAGEDETYAYRLASPEQANAIQRSARACVPPLFVDQMEQFVGEESGEWPAVSLPEINLPRELVDTVMHGLR
jgi:hypothetical protein